MRKNSPLKQRARELRREANPAEQILWRLLRGRRFAGYKFRRQCPYGPYILDFFCATVRLIVELDGESHLGRDETDAVRQQWLEGQGLKVLRFWNNQIYDDLESVMEMIWSACESAVPPPPHPQPLSPEAGERGGSSGPRLG
jgi:very-short-patch-repair endonuclease